MEEKLKKEVLIIIKQTRGKLNYTEKVQLINKLQPELSKKIIAELLGCDYSLVTAALRSSIRPVVRGTLAVKIRKQLAKKKREKDDNT